jgi:Flp pilus assembly protein TadG
MRTAITRSEKGFKRRECIQMSTPRPAKFARNSNWRGEHGAELVEMAFVLPLLLTLLIGIFWGARAYNIYETITRAAREGARVAVAPSCATCGNASPSSSTIQTAVDNVLASANMATSGSGLVTVNIQQHQALNLDPLNTNAQWTVISITYPFQFTLPFTSIGTVNISTQVQMLEE